MTRPEIVFYDIQPADAAIFEAALGDDFKSTFITEPLSAANVLAASAAAVISVRTTSRVTAGLLERLPRLQHIASRTTGYDHLDRSAAQARNISISTVPAYGENTIAEYAFMLLLALNRRLVASLAAARARNADRLALEGHDLAGKILGVIGAGRIGQHAARIGRGFGMTVLAYDLYENPSAAQTNGFSYAPLEQVLASADYLTLHAPSTPQTHHLLDAAALASLKPGAVVVNTARGPLIDTSALVAALQDGHVAGAGLDVVEGEEYLRQQPGATPAQISNIQALLAMPNVLLTAHTAVNSAEALGRIRQTAIENLQAWRLGKAHNLLAP